MAAAPKKINLRPVKVVNPSNPFPAPRRIPSKADTIKYAQLLADKEEIKEMFHEAKRKLADNKIQFSRRLTDMHTDIVVCREVIKSKDLQIKKLTQRVKELEERDAATRFCRMERIHRTESITVYLNGDEEEEEEEESKVEEIEEFNTPPTPPLIENPLTPGPGPVSALWTPEEFSAYWNNP